MLVYKKNKSKIHLHVIPVMKCGCVFWEFAKSKLATRKDKLRQDEDKDNQHEKRGLRNLQLKVECGVSSACFGHQTVQQTSSGNS
jgi:hypothetical protein